MSVSPRFLGNGAIFGISLSDVIPQDNDVLNREADGGLIRLGVPDQQLYCAIHDGHAGLMETNNAADQTAVTGAYAIKNQQLAVPGYRFTVYDPSHHLAFLPLRPRLARSATLACSQLLPTLKVMLNPGGREANSGDSLHQQLFGTAKLYAPIGYFPIFLKVDSGSIGRSPFG